MQLRLTCKYCGHCWFDIANKIDVDNIRCVKCRDKNITVKRLEDVKIDYYQGSPPFANRELEDREEPDMFDQFDWSFSGSMD